jgi:enhancing lycopene biosynthesis protein 2
MLEKALGKLEVILKQTLVVEMADTVSILAVLEAEHLETPVEEMLGVVR